MDNLNIKTVHVCRTCMKEIINTTSFFLLDFTQIDSEPTIRQKLSYCIPELDLSIVPNTVICGDCADTINSLYIFKEECIRLELQIHEYIQQVQNTDNAINLTELMQFHQLHSKNLTAVFITEAFEETENYKNEESTTSFHDNYAFNKTERYTEIVNKKYLTSLQMVDRERALFNTFANFVNRDQSEAENSDTHDDSNIIEDCLVQVVENPGSYIQNINKTDISYQCLRCGRKAESKLKLNWHLKRHTNNKLNQNKISSKSRKSLPWYRCDLCNYTTKHKCLLSFHNRSHLTKKDYRHILRNSPILVKTFISNIAVGKINKDSKIECGSRGSKKRNFKYWCKAFSKCSKSKQHAANVTKQAIDKNINVKPLICWICEICGFSSNYKTNLKPHMLTHSGEKPFKCSVCEHSFNQKSNLKAHLLTHAEEKPFKCPVCEYSCKRKHHLKCHMLTHTGEKPFKCTACEYSCNRKESLKIHMLNHTGEKPFKCSVCEYSCKRKNLLKGHMLTHTDKKNI